MTSNRTVLLAEANRRAATVAEIKVRIDGYFASLSPRTNAALARAEFLALTAEFGQAVSAYEAAVSAVRARRNGGETS